MLILKAQGTLGIKDFFKIQAETVFRGFRKNLTIDFFEAQGQVGNEENSEKNCGCTKILTLKCSKILGTFSSTPEIFGFVTGHQKTDTILLQQLR